MARELTGSQQARRAGLWDGVRPEALVPRERDPLTGSLTGPTDPDGGAKDRRTESSRAEASSSAPGPRAPKGRWPAVAAAGAVALVVGVGGAVALSNRDSDDPRATTTGAAGTGASPAAPSGSTSPGVPPTVLPAQQDRSYSGTMTSTVPGSDGTTSPMGVGVSCTDTVCRLLGWSPSGRLLTWGPGETVVTQTVPQIGEVTNMCEGKESFSPEGSWVMTVTDDALSFTVTFPEETAQCGGGSSVGTSGIVYEFDGVRSR